MGKLENIAAMQAKLTQEALDDVVAGRLVAHEDVKTWADSLGTDHPLPLPQPPRRS